MRGLVHFMAILVFPAISIAQGAALPAPNFSNVSYGPHARNVLDLWQARSARPTPLVIWLHPGGFFQGDKGTVPAPFVTELLANGISVAAVNYRLTDAAPFPAAMLDGARAVQFIRHKSAEWNVDPKLIGASGGSAGGGIALWVGFHDDLADPNAADPVLRQSTRLRVIGVQNTQSSYDPRWVRTALGRNIEEAAFFRPFYALGDTELNSAKAHDLYEKASPITYASSGDPPVFLLYTQVPRGPLAADATADHALHHIRHGEVLKEALDRLGIECVLKHRDDYGASAMRFGGPDLAAFFAKHLR